MKVRRCSLGNYSGPDYADPGVRPSASFAEICCSAAPRWLSGLSRRRSHLVLRLSAAGGSFEHLSSQFVAAVTEPAGPMERNRSRQRVPRLAVDRASHNKLPSLTESGVGLISRGPSGTFPTPAGRQLYARCVAILREATIAEAGVRGFSNSMTGEIKIGLMPA